MPLLSRNRALPGSLTASAIDSALCSVRGERSPGPHMSLDSINNASTFNGLQTLNGETQIFQLKTTGDLFPTYEEYLEGASHLREPIWTCRLTGSSNITFYEALASERESLKKVQTFPKHWAQPVLQIVQGSLDDLETLSRTIAYFCAQNFVAGERVRVLLNDESYPAIIQSVIPGKPTFRVLLLSDGNGFFESPSTANGKFLQSVIQFIHFI
jgi:hypothetical protein